MGTVERGNFGGAPFRESEEMYDAIWATIMEYEGRVSTMAAIGVLRLVEHALLTDAHR
jgi:hypothetical protein